jgi:hypothetical protein
MAGAADAGRIRSRDSPNNRATRITTLADVRNAVLDLLDLLNR